MKRYQENLFLVYETIIIILAIIAVSLTILDFNSQISLEPGTIYYRIDLGILIVFAVDYFGRLFASKDKKEFVKDNIFGLIAIVPFNSLFRIFRAFRLFKLFRITKLSRAARIFRMGRLVKGFALLGKIRRRLNVFIHTNGLIYAFYVATTSIVLGTMGIHYFEFQELGYSFGDSLWWSFVTTSTAGYGDIIPVTIPGRLIAVLLMFIGIGFVGLLTGTITTYFLNRSRSLDDEEERIAELVIDVSNLEDAEVKQIIEFVEFTKSRRTL